jgi:cell wall-associated NlpC family hydrolase
MYIGGGMMVEATHTGSYVMDNPLRTGDGFSGVGRVG